MQESLISCAYCEAQRFGRIHCMNIGQYQKSASILVNIFFCQISIAYIALAKRVDFVTEKLSYDFVLGWNDRDYSGTEWFVTFVGIDMGG